MSEAGEDAAPQRASIMLEVDISAVLEHCRCSICQGIVKNTRAVSACMHRFCKDCIEAWLRTQIDNSCPQCRVKFSSKRDCKADPSFDGLLAAIFGDVGLVERQLLDPPTDVLQHAKSIGQHIAAAAHSRPSPPPSYLHARVQQQRHAADAHAADASAALSSNPAVMAALLSSHAPSSKRPAPPGHGDTKRPKYDDDDSGSQYRGVRFQGTSWQARTKRNGRELSLGLYMSAEEAAMAHDIDRLRQQGSKAQRLNLPALRSTYKRVLAELAEPESPDGLLDYLAAAVQAAASAASSVPGAMAPYSTARASLPQPQPQLPPSQPAAGDAEAAAAEDSEPSSPERELPPVESAAEARARAEQLAALYPLSDGLKGGMAHVQLQAGSGPAWRMTWLACPPSTSVGQLAEAVSVGLSQQHQLAPGALAVGLAVANDLDASASFHAVCYEDAATGNLLLRGQVSIKELLLLLDNPMEALCLEYYAAEMEP